MFPLVNGNVNIFFKTLGKFLSICLNVGGVIILFPFIYYKGLNFTSPKLQNQFQVAAWSQFFTRSQNNKHKGAKKNHMKKSRNLVTFAED